MQDSERVLDMLGQSETRENLLECYSAHVMLESLWTCEDDAKLKALILMWELWGLRNKVNVGDTIRSTLEVTRCREAPTSLLVSKPPSQTSEFFVEVNFDGASTKLAAVVSGASSFVTTRESLWQKERGSLVTLKL
jgi:hypothetical protein